MSDLLSELLKPDPVWEQGAAINRKYYAALEKEKYDFLTDPVKAERLLSHFAHQSLPESKAAKIAHGSPLDKIEKGIPDDDPRKGIAAGILHDAPALIAAASNKRPQEVIAAEYYKRLNDVNKGDALYNYIFEKEANLFNNEVATIPGYEQYKKSKLDEAEQENKLNPLASFAKGAAFDAAFTIGGMALGSAFPGIGTAAGGAAGKLIPTFIRQVALNPLIKRGAQPLLGKAKDALFAGSMFVLGDTLMHPLRTSQWGTANPGKTALLAFGADVVTWRAGEKALLRAAKNFNNFFGESKIVDGFRDVTPNSIFASVSEELAKDPSLKNILASDIVLKDVNKSVAAAPKDLDFWDKKDYDRVIKLVSGGMSEDAAITKVAEKVSARQRGFNLNERVNYLKSVYTDKSTAEILEIASKNIPQVDALKELSAKGFPIEELSKMERPALFKALADVKQKEADLLNVPKVTVDSLARKTATELQADPTATLWSKFEDNFKADFMKNIDNIEKLNAVEVASRRVLLDEMRNRGEVSDDFYRVFNTLYDPEILPSMRRAVISPISEDNRQQWLDEVMTAMKHFADAGDINRFNSFNSLFGRLTDNVGRMDKKTLVQLAKEAESKMKEVFPTAEYDKIFELDSANTSSLFNNILYGQSAELLRNTAKGMLASGSSVEEVASKMNSSFARFLGVGAVSAMAFGAVSAGDLLGTSEAEAAGIPSAVKLIPRMVRSFVEHSPAKTMQEGIKVMYEKGYAFPEITPDGFGIKRYQKFWGMTPDVGDLARTAPIRYFQGWLTPGALGQIFFKDWASPQPQAAYMTTMAINNADIAIRALRNIVGSVSSYKRSTNEIREMFSPLAKKYAVQLAEASYLEKQIENIDLVFQGKYKNLVDPTQVNLARLVRKGKLDLVEKAQLDELKRWRDIYATQRTGYDDLINNFGLEWKGVAMEAAKRYSSSRIALAVENVGMAGENAWLRPMLSEKEMWAVNKIREINSQVEGMMVAVGERPLTAQSYIHHASHPDISYKDLAKGIGKLTPDGFTGADMAHFHHRAVWSKQLMPDIEYVMEKYLPDAHMRVGMAEFWNTWRPFKRLCDMKGYRGVSMYLENLERGFRNVDEYGTINKWAQRIQMFEVARLISLSPSVALKHGFKVLSNVANYGFRNAIENLPRDLDALGRNLRMDYTNSLPKNAYEAVMKGHINTQRIYTIANDMAMYGLPKTTVDRMLDTWNDKGSFMLRASETFDRGTSFLNAITMASKQGMTPEQASYLVMDAILKNNFLSGIHNPTWLRDPKVRLLFLFQGTPFKLFEQRLLTTIRGGQAISGGVKETYKQLQNLKQDLAEGTHNFKLGLIKDALMSKKDLAGNSYIAQLMRNILVIGATVESGKYFLDSDMWGMFHVPFVKHQEESVSLGLNPVMNAAWQAHTDKDEDAYFLSNFLRRWVSTGGGEQLLFAPAAVSKAYRLSKNDIPEIYKNSAFRYVFALPAVKDE